MLSTNRTGQPRLSVLPLLRALGDLKRIRSAGQPASIAERLFTDAWSCLLAGVETAQVARAIVVDGLIATQLGDLSTLVLDAAGIPAPEIDKIRDQALRCALHGNENLFQAQPGDYASQTLAREATPSFVSRLAAQPRAGATCPGRGRLMLEPPETHAEHCVVVAIAGFLLAPVWSARPCGVFLAGLSHHLHNALLPDSGYAGEVLLGEWLQPAMTNATNQALDQLPAALRTNVEAARRMLPDAETPEGRAFHAADTLDRVLQLEHHLRAGNTSMDFVLRDMELVHAGPTKPFQNAVLKNLGLAA